MVQRVDAAVYMARTRPQWPANKHPQSGGALQTGRVREWLGCCERRPLVFETQPSQVVAPLPLSKHPY